MGQMRPYREGDLEQVLLRLRDADRREIESISGTPIDALSVILPPLLERTWTLEADRPSALLGTQDAGDGTARVWLFGTDDIVTHRYEFLRKSAAGLQEVFGHYTALHNVADARNTTHIRWLRWLGFTVLRRIEAHGALQIPVLEFAKLNPHV